MGTEAPTPIVIPVHCAPKKAPCPRCGKRGRRKRTVTRRVRTVAYKAVAYLEITYGEYAARCECSHHLPQHPRGRPPPGRLRQQGPRPGPRAHPQGRHERRTDPPVAPAGVPPRSVLGLRLRRAPRPGRRSSTWPTHRRKVLEHFSGTLCVDELHLGRFTLLLATDPLSDLPVAFALVAANDQDHMRRFLKNLKTWGLVPRGRGHRRLEPLPGRAGRTVARRGPSVVRLPRHQGHQQADPRRRAAAADGDGPAGPGRTEEEAGPQGGQGQGRRRRGGA